MREGSKKAKQVRVGVLLTVLLGVGLWFARIKYLENWTPDWSERQKVSVVLLVPSNLTDDEKTILKALDRYTLAGDDKATFDALEHWFGTEHKRYGGSSASPVTFQILGPAAVESAPPAPPRAGEQGSFMERYKQTKAFLDFFEAQRVRLRPEAQNVVFVTFFRPESASVFRSIHSVADRRSRSGFVFCELSNEGVEVALINVGHELLHLYGASDKYEGQRCLYPQGFYAPFQEPRFPQAYAEVMAQGIPQQAGGVEASLNFFEQMRVGVETAYEIGWIPEDRRDRYYTTQAAAAGPQRDD